VPKAAWYWGGDSSAVNDPLGAPGSIPLYLCLPVVSVTITQQDNNNSRIRTSTSIQDQLPAILTIFNNNNFNNFNDFNHYQQHSALYSQFIVLYFILQTQNKYYIHQDISRNNLKKFCILVIVNVNNSLKQCNGSVIIPNGPVNSEVNLSIVPLMMAETYVG
jgi:hypothetical protein